MYIFQTFSFTVLAFELYVVLCSLFRPASFPILIVCSLCFFARSLMLLSLKASHGTSSLRYRPFVLLFPFNQPQSMLFSASAYCR